MVTLRNRKKAEDISPNYSAAWSLGSPLRTTSALYPGRGEANHLSSGGWYQVPNCSMWQFSTWVEVKKRNKSWESHRRYVQNCTYHIYNYIVYIYIIDINVDPCQLVLVFVNLMHLFATCCRSTRYYPAMHRQKSQDCQRRRGWLGVRARWSSGGSGIIWRSCQSSTYGGFHKWRYPKMDGL